jgi:hypothetical protein
MMPFAEERQLGHASLLQLRLIGDAHRSGTTNRQISEIRFHSPQPSCPGMTAVVKWAWKHHPRAA